VPSAAFSDPVSTMRPPSRRPSSRSSVPRLVTQAPSRSSEIMAMDTAVLARLRDVPWVDAHGRIGKGWVGWTYSSGAHGAQAG